MLTKRFMASFFRNRQLWFWSVGFIVFWLFMGAFVFTGNTTLKGVELKEYVATWFSIDSLLSISAVGVTIAFTIYFSSSSLAYLFRNSRMTPMRYFFETSIAVGLAFVLIGSILTVLTIAFFYAKFGVLIYPKLFYLTILLFFSSGIIFYSLSSALVVVSNNWLGLRNINFVSFIPMFLGFGFGYSILYAELPKWLAYSNFISPMVYLYLYSFLGNAPTLELIDPSSPKVSLILSAISVMGWLFILGAISLVTIRLIKASYIEEVRQI